MPKPIYLDCNATTPIDPEVADIVMHYLGAEYGNSGSRTHVWGSAAKKAVNQARSRIAETVAVAPAGVVFTSGATESNNLAILGLEDYARSTGRRHIVTSRVEHKAVLEPVEELARRGFEVAHVSVGSDGIVNTDEVLGAIREDTVLVSLIAVNNETGAINPVEQIAEELSTSGFLGFFHVDAAQALGKIVSPLQHPRIDMLSLSAHKAHGPKGIGALALRHRNYKTPPLRPLLYGGGQERGLRPGTLPVPLIAGFGHAAELAHRDHMARAKKCAEIKETATRSFKKLGAEINGDPERSVPHTLNVSVPGIDSEAAILALQDIVSCSNGSACTSDRHEPSHVLTAMGLKPSRVDGALRFSWCHLTPELDWEEVRVRLAELL
jgi:cysteine desulfurase